MRNLFLVPVMLALYASVRILPLAPASKFIAWVFKHSTRTFIKTGVIDSNLSMAFPELETTARRRMVSQIAENFGRSIVEIINLPAFASGTEGTTIAASGDLEFPLSDNNQAVYVSAHLGNWELMPLVFANRPRKMRIIYTPLSQSIIEKKLSALRQTTGSIYVSKSDAIKACYSAMKDGAPVAMLVDQRVKNGVGVNFFGQETQFTRLPARLAIKFNCPIIFVEAIRTAHDTQEVYFHEPIWPGGSGAANLERQMTQEMAWKVEQAIRLRPADWFCNKRRWKKNAKVRKAPVPAVPLTLRNDLAHSTSDL